MIIASQPHYSYSFSNARVIEYLSRHKKAFKELKTVWPVSKKDVVKMFRFNQERWRAFKWLLKRVERGELADIWLRWREEKPIHKQIRRVFDATEQEFSKCAEAYVEHHQYRCLDNYSV